MKNKLLKIFINEFYSKPPKRNYPTNKIISIYIDETWSIGLADFSGYKTSNNKVYRYIFVIIDYFSKCFWAIIT